MSKVKEIAGFRVLSAIGEGAASTLYAVQDVKTKQVWALKYVERETEKDQRFIEQMEAECEVGQKLDHRNIRAVKRLVRHRKMFKTYAVSLVMELIDAHTLDQQLPETQLEALKIFRQVAEGLAHMHSRGFIHADMKPNNVLITDDGTVKIIDLGQACKVGAVKTRIQGTPGYMAPEQAHRQTITPQTDIYNLGAMMYWTLVGEVIPTALPPKDGSNSLYSGALDASQVEMPTPPHEKRADIHPLLSKQIMDCVQVDPADRPVSMDAVADRLELIIDLLENPPDPSQIIDEETTF